MPGPAANNHKDQPGPAANNQKDVDGAEDYDPFRDSEWDSDTSEAVLRHPTKMDEMPTDEHKMDGCDARVGAKLAAADLSDSMAETRLEALCGFCACMHTRARARVRTWAMYVCSGIDDIIAQAEAEQSLQIDSDAVVCSEHSNEGRDGSAGSSHIGHPSFDGRDGSGSRGIRDSGIGRGRRDDGDRRDGGEGGDSGGCRDGKDGRDGRDGKDDRDGRDGKDGRDGSDGGGGCGCRDGRRLQHTPSPSSWQLRRSTCDT